MFQPAAVQVIVETLLYTKGQRSALLFHQTGDAG